MRRLCFHDPKYYRRRSSSTDSILSALVIFCGRYIPTRSGYPAWLMPFLGWVFAEPFSLGFCDQQVRSPAKQPSIASIAEKLKERNELASLPQRERCFAQTTSAMPPACTIDRKTRSEARHLS